MIKVKHVCHYGQFLLSQNSFSHMMHPEVSSTCIGLNECFIHLQVIVEFSHVVRCNCGYFDKRTIPNCIFLCQCGAFVYIVLVTYNSTLWTCKQEYVYGTHAKQYVRCYYFLQPCPAAQSALHLYLFCLLFQFLHEFLLLVNVVLKEVIAYHSSCSVLLFFFFFTFI